MVGADRDPLSNANFCYKISRMLPVRLGVKVGRTFTDGGIGHPFGEAVDRQFGIGSRASATANLRCRRWRLVSRDADKPAIERNGPIDVRLFVPPRQ